MLRRDLRLSSKRDFNKIYKFGKTSHGKNVLCKAFAIEKGNTKVAVVVSKKVSPKAVVRGRIKRRIREIIRKDWSSIPQNYNILVIAKNDSSKIDSLELGRDVLGCIKKAVK